METQILAVEQLYFNYEENNVLQGVNFEMHEGEIFCLMGPNGCGKTTLMDCILGIQKGKSGKILIKGVPQQNFTQTRLARTLAYIPQNHVSNFPFTVLDFIQMGRAPHLGLLESPGKHEKEMALSVLKELGLLEIAGHDYTKLSGGETRMVLIARCLVQESSLLIMDEPGSHLDFHNEYIMLEKIINLVKNQNRSVLLSTHSPNQVFFLASSGVPVRVAIMKDGKIFHCGLPQDILTPEILKEVYNLNTALVSHTVSGSRIINIVPIPSHFEV